ncbi:MAG: 3-deoxy-D-manno-octulosonic acid transferase [Deltaproteobacteria bacterium]|nr:3-deoxy-D-manno-octulosonic acid transferase [Deltaproteobacteria bacterium]
MNNYLIYLAYQLVTGLLGLAAWPWFRRHLTSRGGGESFFPRLGLQLPPAPPPGRPRIWLHGVSVGEILSAVALVREVRALLPGAALTLSTGTETGQAVARRHFAPGCQVCYFPLDLPWAVQGYLGRLRPDIFIALESEIWPGFLTAAHRRGVRLALLNARLSDRTLRRYLKYGRYLLHIFKYFELITVPSATDRERLLSLGIPPALLHVTGNLKVDGLLARQEQARADLPELRRVLGLNSQPVLAAASTHAGEEEVVLEAYQKLLTPSPTLLLLLAPRHPERAPEVARLLDARGLAWQSWQILNKGEEPRRAPVVLVDTVGDLFGLYGVADLAFVGGSLAPHGGQNLLEPAAWGLAPLYGPHLHNFRWAQNILESARAGFLIDDAAGLARALRRFLDHPDERAAAGRRAREALLPHQGAARRQAELIAGMVW